VHQPPTRVLYLMTTLDVGGAERSLLELVRRLDRERFAPVVCTLISGGRLVQAFTELGVPVHELGVGPGVAELNGLRLAPLLARLRPHVVHSRLILSNLWARTARLGGAKVICEERGLAEERPPIFDLLNRLTGRFATVTLGNSQAVADRIRERDGIERVRVIRGGVDVARFCPRPDGQAATVDVVAVTRLERYKGVFELIEAMEEVVYQRPGTRLAMFGDGSARGDLEASIKRRGLEEAVELRGEATDVPGRLREGRVFVLASYEEGLPNAVMEAMSTGLPVVATRVGGTAELVVESETGALVPPRDPAGLARALLDYLNHPERAAAHGAKGRVRALAELDITLTVRAYEALYDELVGDRGAA
jgi:glycosyltransferase involved in cell wall biosynthesis